MVDSGEVPQDIHRTPSASVPALTWVGLPGAPVGVGWTQARWARSWGLRFGTAGPGSSYEAVLSAGGGSVAVTTLEGEQVIRDAETLRRTLASEMTRRAPAEGIRRWPGLVEEYVSAAKEWVAGRPGGAAALSSEELARQVEAYVDSGQAWQHIAAVIGRTVRWEDLEGRMAGFIPSLIGDYLGLGLLAMAPEGHLSSYGPSTAPTAVIIATGTGTGAVSQWVGALPAVSGPVLSGLSASQVAWAAEAGMRFVDPGPHGGDFVGTLMTAAGASNVAVLYQGDPGEFRRELAKRIRGDRALAGSPDWDTISGAYVNAKVLAGENAGDVRWRLGSGEALEEIIAQVQKPERGNTVIGRIWPLLVNRYLGTGIQILSPDGATRLHGGQDVTLAVVPGPNPGEDIWVGVAPVAAPAAAGAGTRPADVPGGWSQPAPDRPTVADMPAKPALPAPDGLTAAQQQWARAHHMRFADMAPGQILDAVLAATGGGFTTTEGAAAAVCHRRCSRGFDRRAGNRYESARPARRRVCRPARMPKPHLPDERVADEPARRAQITMGSQDRRPLIGGARRTTGMPAPGDKHEGTDDTAHVLLDRHPLAEAR